MDQELLSTIIETLPSLLWFILIIILLCILHSQISQALSTIIWRLKSGAQVKIASLELGSIYVSPRGEIAQRGGPIEVREDDSSRYEERGQYYLPNRDLFLVHRLYPSKQPSQVYDILIYLIPHKDATLAGVQKVEYYFGPHWNHRIFTSIDRASGFSISTSAFGPFTCTADLHFTDGTKTMVWRYIDFEMGQLAKD